ncbi:hypothetical protein K7472_19255 [Streptomyces sp. PTM05]|uniref:N-acetyltransferase domain-containing protein n=1 Tax=Streptantibioticus parmotrematis TaxID=2873249 RepID=A0ABS7QUT0_9ACTN|nr:hypothetical protein [Streptantibioticus parmotrematis]MBY8886978.1 hypothetical protein [Streptantibioticus parmotrematis]
MTSDGSEPLGSGEPIGRSASELPADPRLLRLDYCHEQTDWNETYDPLEWWHVRVGLVHDSRAAEAACTAADRSDVGHLRFCRVRDSGRHDMWRVARAPQVLGSVADAILDEKSGEFTDPFQQALSWPVGDLLVVDHVALDECWRGFGLRSILLAEALGVLASGCCAVLSISGMSASGGLRAEPLGQPCAACVDPREDVVNEHWAGAAFRPFRADVWFADPGLREFETCRQRRVADLLDLSHAFGEQVRRDETQTRDPSRVK